MASLEMFFDEGFVGVFFGGVEWVYFGDFGNEYVFKVYGVVKWAMRGKLFIGFLQKYISEVGTEFQNGCFLGFFCLGNLC